MEAPTPSKFPVIATQPGSLMVVCEGKVGGMAVVEDTVDPPRSPKHFDGMLQAPTRASLTRLYWSNRGFWWPTLSTRRCTGALANRYELAVWRG